MLLCMGLKICLDEDLYRFLASVHFHSDRVVAKIYLMPTTVLASNNGIRHLLPLSVTNIVQAFKARPAPSQKNRREKRNDPRVNH
jgi:hypothetical protein